jgi:hypothetical protein
MKPSAKIRKVLRVLAEIAAGIIGFFLFNWTPKTIEGVAVCLVLFAVLIILVILLAPKHEGSWPSRTDLGPGPDDSTK